MTSHLYRAVWPIVDLSWPAELLIAAASRQVDAMAAGVQARIVGEVRWLLLGEGPATPLPHPSGRHGWVAAETGWIRAMAGRGLTDAQIADLVGCSESGVAKVRTAARPPIPPGVGNPTRSGAPHRSRPAADAA